ncbi:MAG: hypothetical protein AMXMBFR55_28950 [Gemmatimonadota bacterium]
MAHELEALVPHQVRDVVGVAGDEVVEPDDLVPLPQEAVGEVRPQEAGGAGDEDAHQPPLPMESYRKPSARILAGS